jgi:hypothetical protein
MLIHEVCGLVSDLRSAAVRDLVEPFVQALEQAQRLLEAPASTRAQKLLILSATQRQMSRIEKLARERILANRELTSEEMAVLVGIRSGCHRAVLRISDDMELLRRVPAR